MDGVVLSPQQLGIIFDPDESSQSSGQYSTHTTGSSATVSTASTTPVSLAGSRVSLRDYGQPRDHPPGAQCGWLCFKPRCLQSSLTSRWLLFWLCWAAAVQGMVVNGFVNVCITTIEKRFDLRSTDTGFMATTYDIASVLCSVPVAYFGSRKGASKAKWLGIGMLIMGMGSFIFALPHFITPRYDANGMQSDDSNKSVITCSSQEPQIQVSCDNFQEGMLSSFRHVFTLGQILHGIGATPLYTLGVTFLDESVPMRMSSFYLGVYYAMAVVGPAIGYVMGGQFLNIYINAPYEDAAELGLDPSSDRWLGGWWMGFMLSGLACFLVAWPLLGFPASLPNRKSDDIDSDSGPKRSKHSSMGAASAGADAFKHLNNLPSATLSVLRNVTFVCLSLAGASEGIILTGFATFMPKFIESQFGVAASSSAKMLGFIAVPAGGGGTLLGGWLIKKYELSCRAILKSLLMGSIVCLLLCLSLLLYCPSQQFAGIDVHYDGSLRSLPLPELNATCNANCRCNGVAYNPVCGANNVVYYSPCHAGCVDRQFFDKYEVYTNCSCIASSPLEASSLHSSLSNLLPEEVLPFLPSQSVVVRDKCFVSCLVMPFFLFLCFALMFATFTISMPALSGTLRCLEEDQRALALGVQWIIARVIGTIPGPIIFGAVIDHSCRLWQNSCDVKGSCLSYNNFAMSRYILGISLVAKTCSTICFIIACWFFKPPSGESQPPDTLTPIPSNTHTPSGLSLNSAKNLQEHPQHPQLAYDNPSVEVT